MSRLVCLVALLVACGDDSSSVGDAGDDAATFDAAVDAPGIDAPGIDAPGIDAPGTDSGGVDAGGDAGTEECGSGDVATGWEVPLTCLEADCMDHPACEAADLAAAGYGDYEPCGTVAITPASSVEACMMEPPFGPFPESPPYNCGTVQYEGSIRFFCNADRTSVAARFVAIHADETGFTEYFGHEYWAGSGGGSGDSRSYSAYIDPNRTRFFGWQQVSLEPESSTQLQVWFMTGSFVDPEIGMSYTGGFTATVPPE